MSVTYTLCEHTIQDTPKSNVVIYALLIEITNTGPDQEEELFRCLYLASRGWEAVGDLNKKRYLEGRLKL